LQDSTGRDYVAGGYTHPVARNRATAFHPHYHTFTQMRQTLRKTVDDLDHIDCQCVG